MAGIDDIKNLDWKPIWGATVVLLAIMAGSYWYFLEKPANESMKRLQVRIGKLDGKIRVGEAAERNYGKLSLEIRKLEDKLQQTISILPQESALDRLVRQVESLALQSNLDVKVFDPGRRRKKGFYGIQPVSLRLKGTYKDLAGFVEKVAKEERIINLTDIVMNVSKRSLNISMKVQVFWFVAGKK